MVKNTTAPQQRRASTPGLEPMGSELLWPPSADEAKHKARASPCPYFHADLQKALLEGCGHVQVPHRCQEMCRELGLPEVSE